MASTSETGHNKNAANYGAGILILQEMATLYDPTNSMILLPTLTPVKTAIDTALSTLTTQFPLYKNGVADREDEIKSMSKTATKIGSYANSLDISDKDKQNIAALVQKVRGDTKSKKVNPELSTATDFSTSQMSYDSRIANFNKLIQQAASLPEYTPNENEIKITTLTTYYNLLLTLTTAVNSSADKIITARADRNKILYYNDNNIIKLATLIKAYLKSLGEAGKPYYKAFVKLKFSDIKK